MIPQHIRPDVLHGTISDIIGQMVRVRGLTRFLNIGSRCDLITRGGHAIPAEVVGFDNDEAILMGFAAIAGLGPGCIVVKTFDSFHIQPASSWLGRILNAFGEPLDGKGPLELGKQNYDLYGKPPPTYSRSRIGPAMDLGVKSINIYTTCCRGQRMGIFAASGVGKSVLLSQFAKFSSADVNVIGLIGERGRELKEFIEDYLGEEGIQKSVIVVATSDEPPLVRRQAAFLTMTIAEFFRDHNRHVLCLLDSITRFAMALREIGLTVGEPPTSKGYPPSAFSVLPQLLERAGPGLNQSHVHGAITGLFTVLVEGDDLDEPVSDTVRGILDGHIILDRSIAERGRFPPVNILKSVSRTMPDCNPKEWQGLIQRSRDLWATYEDMSDMIRLGAYKSGSDQRVDEAMFYVPKIENFLKQDKFQKTKREEAFQELKSILSQPFVGNAS